MKHKNGFLRSIIGQSWNIETTPAHIAYKNNEGSGKIKYFEVSSIKIKHGLVSDSVIVRHGSKTLSISNFSEAGALQLHHDLINTTKKAIAESINKQPKKLSQLSNQIEQFLTEERYLAQSDIREWLGTFPEIGNYLSHPFFEVAYLEQKFQDSLSLLQDIQSPNSITLQRRNEIFVRSAMKRHSKMFDKLEKFPLTVEQRRAAVIDEDRNLLIAAAGSGKSSTIVAKTAYLIESKLAEPGEILILAYNKYAQLEIEERIKTTFHKLKKTKKIPTTKTFHSIGLDLVSAISGRKPKISKLAGAQGKTANSIFSELISEIALNDHSFYEDWAQFITVAKQPLPEESEIKTKEDYERFLVQVGAKKTGPIGKQSYRLTTIDNNEVKSLQELRLYNWLIVKGIRFEYERPYEFETGDATHSQYHPDFFYPDANLYHEHFALDASGKAPEFMTNYLDGVNWKRQQHEKNKTAHIETTSADFYNGKVFDILEVELQKAGVSFNPLTRENLDQLIQNSFETEYDTELFVTFLRHFKSNGFSFGELEEKFKTASDKYRVKLFLKIFQKFFEEYQKRLSDAGEIDFEDQINLAAEWLEDTDVTHSWKYILVDEFQDISQDRYRLVQALLSHGNNIKLFAVGDDWQSIYRFAGADIDIMTNFENHFGATAQNSLTTTFRSYQGLIDIASDFVQRNPNQLKKIVKSVKSNPVANQVIVKEYTDDEDQSHQILALLEEISNKGKSNKTKLNVFIMARYGFQLPQNRSAYRDFSSTLDINFTTVHASKGQEADYILLLNVNSGKNGFPSLKEDDPLIRLILPRSEQFSHAEERRLFYVALTRAKRGAFLFSRKNAHSIFISELAEYDGVSMPANIRDARKVALAESKLGPNDECPKCKAGKLKIKTDKSGLNAPFLGCSKYPSCRNTIRTVCCPRCDSGKIVRRVNRKTGEIFYPCSSYDCGFRLRKKRHN